MRCRWCTLHMWKSQPRPGNGIHGPFGCRACWRSSGPGFLIFADIVVALAGNLSDTAPPREGWVYPAIIGQCVLAGASVLALVTGLRFPARRRVAAITAWMIIPVGLGWLVLTSRLLGGS